ncbi:hypothetical protein TNCV_903561 [Trichonephila clavipes]|nr:hypothetical protein TNCV_903561 [Trichonephila clavipes]
MAKYDELLSALMERIADYPSEKIGKRVRRNQATVMRICHCRMQEETTDRWGQSYPPRCTTSRDDRGNMRMTVMDHVATSRTIAHNGLASFGVHLYHSTTFAAEWNVPLLCLPLSGPDYP